MENKKTARKGNGAMALAVTGFFLFAVILVLARFILLAFPIVEVIGETIVACVVYVIGGICVGFFFWHTLKKQKGEENGGAPSSIAEKYPSIPYAQWAAEEKERQKQEKRRQAAQEQTSVEMAQFRKIYEPDIDVILSQLTATWRWASPTAPNRVYVTPGDNPYGIFEGVLQIANDRVEAITIDGRTYKNLPLLKARDEAKKEAKAKAKAELDAKVAKFSSDIVEFFGTRKDGTKATFANLNPDKGTFSLTAPLDKMKVQGVKAIAEYSNGKIVAVRFSYNGKQKTLKRGKQAQSPAPTKPAKPAPVEQPAPAPKEEQPSVGAPAKSGETPAEKPTPVEPQKPAAKPEVPKASPVAQKETQAPEGKPVAGRNRPSHADPVDIHQPSGMSRDAIDRNAALYADYYAAQVNEKAVDAYNRGEEYFDFPWPKRGLPTLEDLEAFAHKVVDGTENLRGYETLEAERVFRIYLGQPEAQGASGFIAVAEEMVDDLERQAVKLRFEEGEQWLCIPWPEEVYCQKDADEFARIVVDKSIFDGYKIDSTGDGRILFHSPAVEENPVFFDEDDGFVEAPPADIGDLPEEEIPEETNFEAYLEMDDDEEFI